MLLLQQYSQGLGKMHSVDKLKARCNLVSCLLPVEYVGTNRTITINLPRLLAACTFDACYEAASVMARLCILRSSKMQRCLYLLP